MRVNSLKFRLVISVILTVVILLPLLGITINNAFIKHLTVATQKQLVAHSYAILSDAEYIDNQLNLPEALLSSQFNVVDSGLYAFITQRQGDENIVKWQSASALDWPYTNQLKSPDQGQRDFYQYTDDQQRFWIFSYAVVFGEQHNELPVVLHVILDQKSFEQSVIEFKSQLWFGLLLVFIVIVSLQLVWLRWTLKPLQWLKSELQQVETGELKQIEKPYPFELQQVTHQLNHLLTSEQNQRERYRNALSDLAHSLKTPLAVIRSDSTLGAFSQKNIDAIDQMIEHQLKKAQSAGQSAWRLSIFVEPVINKLLDALAKIYRDKQLTVQVKCFNDCVFKGDEADLMEVIGNVLDNAYKAAVNHIDLSVSTHEQWLLIEVEDDGIGITPDKRADILTRGTRADTYEQGHGIGLAIVRDLVQSYQGKLVIDHSKKYSGALFKIYLPN